MMFLYALFLTQKYGICPNIPSVPRNNLTMTGPQADIFALPGGHMPGRERTYAGSRAPISALEQKQAHAFYPRLLTMISTIFTTFVSTLNN